MCVSEAAAKFVETAKRFRYVDGQGGPSRTRTNFTFWAGAGFSKSWDPDTPVGQQLFTLKGTLEDPFVDSTFISRLFGLDSFCGMGPHELARLSTSSTCTRATRRSARGKSTNRTSG